MSLGNIDKCEPNLIPLLDLVLQLIMFFMLCANFLMEDSNAAIKLPSALQAKPLAKTEDYVITLNVDKDGHVLLGRDQNAERLTNQIQVRNYMRVKYENDIGRQEAAKQRNAAVIPKISLVVIRAHQDCTFKQVNDVLVACRQARYENVQLRAVISNSRS